MTRWNMPTFGLVVVLAACASGSSGEPDAAGPPADGPPPADAPIPPDAPPPDAGEPDAGVDVVMCDPVNQTGCQPNQKCSLLRQDASTNVTACVPAGMVAEGDECSAGPVGPTTGFDDCQGGLLCLSGRCRRICSTMPNSCLSGAQCTIYNNTFEDGIGACDALCDIFNPTSCGSGEGCYLNLGSGVSTCANTVGGGGQNSPCQFLNSCNPGLGCILIAPDQSGNQCATYCDTLSGTGNATCAAIPEIAGGTPRCAQINVFYGDVPQVPDRAGMCVDCSIPAYAGLTACQ